MTQTLSHPRVLPGPAPAEQPLRVVRPPSRLGRRVVAPLVALLGLVFGVAAVVGVVGASHHAARTAEAARTARAAASASASRAAASASPTATATASPTSTTPVVDLAGQVKAVIAQDARATASWKQSVTDVTAQGSAVAVATKLSRTSTTTGRALCAQAAGAGRTLDREVSVTVWTADRTSLATCSTSGA